MPTTYTCPHGHQWEVTLQGSDQIQGLPVCPVCGVPIQVQSGFEGPTGPYAPERPEDCLTMPLKKVEPVVGATTGMTGYEVLQELGRGGMGVVYKARQVQLDRLVALKMILAGSHAGPEDLARFRLEAEAVAQLQHPHIVQIYEIGERDQLPFFSMEFVPGGSLSARIDNRPQPPGWSARLVETLARAMHAAHERGVLHRDLKPDNVLLTADDTPKISDFGLAKRLDRGPGQTVSGAVVGTPSYMAPEQAEGRLKDIGPATDVYALGTILYELLTGRPPFCGRAPVDTIMQVIADEPVSPLRLQPKVPLDLNTICLKCLEKDAGKRYPTALALAEDLRRFQAGEPIHARPVGPVERAVKWAGRRPSIAALIGTSALLLLAILVSSLWFNFRLQAALQTANEATQRAENHLIEVRRQEAETRTQSERAQANARQARAAVDVMLTVVGKDLLEDVPGIDEEKRRELLRSALTFYRGFLDENWDDPATRRETALAFGHLGDINRGLRQLNEAATAYAQAIALQEQLAAGHPEEPRYRRELADSLNWHGEVLRLANQVGQAEAAYGRAIALQERLAADLPDEPNGRQELARTHYNRGILRMETRRAAEARADLATAIRLLRSLQERYPEEPLYRHDLARAEINQAILLKDTAQPVHAREGYGRAIDFLEQLSQEQPSQAGYRLELALALKNRGNLRLEEPGGALPAEEDLQRALPLLARLAQDYPRRPLYRLELARCQNSLAAAAWFLKKVGQAEITFGEAAGLLRQLVREYPEEADYHSELGGTLDNLAVLLRSRGPSNPDQDLEQARACQDEAYPHHLAAVLTNYEHRTYRVNLRKHFAGRAETALRQNQPEEAAQAAQMMAQVLPADAAARFRAARILARCAAAAAPDPAAGFADQAVTVLGQALGLGAEDLRSLKEARDFEPLRSRADFRLLVQKLEKKLNQGP